MRGAADVATIRINGRIRSTRRSFALRIRLPGGVHEFAIELGTEEEGVPEEPIELGTNTADETNVLRAEQHAHRADHVQACGGRGASGRSVVENDPIGVQFNRKGNRFTLTVAQAPAQDDCWQRAGERLNAQPRWCNRDRSRDLAIDGRRDHNGLEKGLEEVQPVN